MEKAKRTMLAFHDPRPRGVCAVCRRVFTGTDSEIQQKFTAHDCKEDASQTAARIVREVTDIK